MPRANVLEIVTWQIRKLCIILHYQSISIKVTMILIPFLHICILARCILFAQTRL